MTILFLLLLGAGAAWVYQNPGKAAEWLKSLNTKKDTDDNKVDPA